ncbi:MAG: hypothetical protein CL424_12205 [Acidimicrobiaceae bacterium]|nr:hypothetical protein [Acidimicrobiaceae bacterium]
MSPAFASGDRRWTIYFYAEERHRLPHAAVRGPGFAFTVRLADGEVLASRGTVPARVVREIQELIGEHRDLFVQAFLDTLDHRFPGTLDEAIERQRREQGGNE